MSNFKNQIDTLKLNTSGILPMEGHYIVFLTESFLNTMFSLYMFSMNILILFLFHA